MATYYQVQEFVGKKWVNVARGKFGDKKQADMMAWRLEQYRDTRVIEVK